MKFYPSMLLILYMEKKENFKKYIYLLFFNNQLILIYISLLMYANNYILLISFYLK